MRLINRRSRVQSRSATPTGLVGSQRAGWQTQSSGPYMESSLVNDGWTPEEILGRFPIDKPGLPTNYESMYQWIYQECRGLSNYLPKAHKNVIKSYNNGVY
jgi:hypothetical protein